MTNAQRFAKYLPAFKLGWLDPPLHRQVVRCWPQVLPDGDDIDTDRGKVEQHTIDLVGRFTHTQHEARLRHKACRLGSRQHAQAARITSRRPNRSLQPRHGFDIVIEHIGPSSKQQSQCGSLALAIGDERLDSRGGTTKMNRLDARCDVSHATVVEIVTGHHREHSMRHAHALDGFSHALGFVARRRQRLVRVDKTEPARTRATFAKHHERCCAIGPTLAEIGAPSFFAHRDEIEIAHGSFQRQHLGAKLHLGPQPLGLAVAQSN